MTASHHYHLVGVAGVGMSALAQALVSAGHRVTGSDRAFDQGGQSEMNRRLRLAGVVCCPQDGSGIDSSTSALVVSSAIEDHNSDLDEAIAKGVPIQHRADLLSALVSGSRCIAVTGTSGKSTVTGMIGWILDQAGESPVVINGAPILNWADDDRVGNFHAGSSAWSVVEADESDRSVLKFKPDWGVITNLSRDHFEIEETRELFEAFKAQCRVGTISAVHDAELLEELTCRPSETGIVFELDGERFELGLAGMHNALNAGMAVKLCEKLDIGLDSIREGLSTFQGIERRLQRVGEAGGVTVYDDYAHNPAKIRAAWTTLAERHDRIQAVWRPHGFGPLRMMLDDLVETFAETCRPCDRLYVLPVYDAGGTADRSIDSGSLVRRLGDNGVVCETLSADFAQTLADQARAGEGILVRGARDPELPVFARELVRVLAGAV
jgi:UDP-N-acetylmuramate-alanine ligase